MPVKRPGAGGGMIQCGLLADQEGSVRRRQSNDGDPDGHRDHQRPEDTAALALPQLAVRASTAERAR